MYSQLGFILAKGHFVMWTDLPVGQCLLKRGFEGAKIVLTMTIIILNMLFSACHYKEIKKDYLLVYCHQCKLNSI